MSDIAVLEALLRNDAAVREAGRAASAAETARTIDRIQLSNAYQRLRESGAIRPPSPAPSAPTPAPSAPTPPPVNAPARPPLSTSARLAQGINAFTYAQLGAAGQGFSRSAERLLRGALPESVRPVYDGINDASRLVSRALSPSSALGDIVNGDFRPAGGIQRDNSSGFGDQLLCNIFGVNCPTSNNGIPNNGSLPPLPPFLGGQMPGVRYEFYISGTQYNANGTTIPKAFGGFLYGPLSNLRIANGMMLLDCHGVNSYSANTITTVTLGAWQPDTSQYPYDVIGPLIITRPGGLPDTGGNPAPSPDAQNRVAIAPALASAPTPQIYPSVTPDSPIAPQNLAPSNPPYPPDQRVSSPPIAPAAPALIAPADSNPESPVNRNNPFPPWLPLALGLPLVAIPFIPSNGRGFTPNGANQPRTNPPRTTTTDIPTPTCRYDSAGISGKVDAANTSLNIIETIKLAEIQSMLTQIDNKLGAQIPNGGISKFLGRTWNFLQIDRILNVLTWIGVLHNAYMLSNNIAQTLFEGIGNVLNVFNIQDEEGNSLDIGQMVSTWTNSFFVSFLGQETVTGIKEGWKLANRIYQSAANIVFSLQSITYSMVEMLEVISNYVGRIGNALKRSGTILANSFSWMNPNVNYTNNRFFNTLENAEEFVENISRVASEVLNIQEVGAQLFDQKEEFQGNLEEGVEFITQQESTNKGASTRPNLVITPADEVRAEQ